MKYAEVAVNSPIAQRRSFCYSVPPHLSVGVGQAIWVPFGSKVLQGVIVKLSDSPSVEVTKEINSLITSSPILSPNQVELAFWLSDHYFSSLFDAVALMLPPGFEQRLVTFIRLLQVPEDFSQLSSEQKELVHLLKGAAKVSFKTIQKRLGRKRAELVIRQLLLRGAIEKLQQLEGVKVKPKLVSYLKLIVDPDGAEAEILRLRCGRAYKQAEALAFLAKSSQPVSLAGLRKSIGCNTSVVKSLIGQGLVSATEVVVRRDPLSSFTVSPSLPPTLTVSQEAAWQKIRESITALESSVEPAVFMLHGVTGSGKTEIYLRALADIVSRGKRGICLVPEIALTPQTIERFASRFPGRVAVLHSGLSMGEQYDEWHRVKDGSCDVVVGPRSALFAPQHNLGLIIIDEEHEWTYKQSDKSPRYHAREAAIQLARSSKAVVILGSATPDVWSFYQCQRGRYHLIELKERITPRGFSPLPEVELVNLSDELKAGNRSLFSRTLTGAISEALSKREQVILFLNRRGTATFVECGRCGLVMICQRCSVPLAYHSVSERLVCHHCRHSTVLPEACPQCLAPRMKLLGVGTQRVEAEVRHLFPNARILRWDRDVTFRPRAHQEILHKFRSREADVLIGTQMVAKGLDFPQVTLSGVISADTGLNLPDFRAGERTFQLLCQVAGRAGRGLTAGKVIIQTYCPEHYAIQAAAKHDYYAFYAREIEYRRQFGYPPFSSLVRLVFSHTNAVSCRKEAERVSRLITVERDRRGIPDLRLIGPAPAFVPRLRGRYQWHMFLCGAEPVDILSDVHLPYGWVVDVDPVGVV